MIIRVKEKESGKKNKKNREGEQARKRENEEESKRHWGDSLIDHDSLVEVGYGLCYLIVNSK